MTVIRASAPTRIDLAGGTLDLWPLSMMVDDAVTVNCAIDIRTGCEIEFGGTSWRFEPRGLPSLDLRQLPRRPEREVPGTYQLAAVVAGHFGLPPCRIATWSDAAPGSGLGGSSSLIIGLIAAAVRATDRELTDREAVDLACNLETRVLRLPAGSQDHWAAQCGGLSILEYGPEGVQRSEARAEAAAAASSLVVADTGVEHHSGMNNWTVFRGVLEGDAAAGAALAEVSRAAAAMRDAVRAEVPLPAILGAMRRALSAEWQARRRLSSAVSCPEVEAIVAAAESIGGAAKVCGAGGGGCVACLPASSAGRAELERAIEATGARVLEAKAAPRGVQVA